MIIDLQIKGETNFEGQPTNAVGSEVTSPMIRTVEHSQFGGKKSGQDNDDATEEEVVFDQQDETPHTADPTH